MSDKKIMETVIKLAGSIDPSLAKSIKDAQENFRKMDKTVFAVKASLVAVGAVAIKAMGDATKKAAEFEKQMSNVATLLDGDVNKRVGELSKELIKVSNKSGVATADLTDGLYQVVSAFGDSAEASKQLEIAAKAAKAGNATTTDAINMLSAVTKGYGDTCAEAQQKAADLAFQTVKLGQTSFPELAASMGKVIPLAATMGVKQEELFGAMATLTGVTGKTAEVTTQLRGAVQGFLQPTEDMITVINALGYANGQEMIKANGLQTSLEMLKTAVGGNEIAFSSLFGSVEAKGAVLALTGAQADAFTQKTKAMYEASGIAEKAFKAQTDNVEDLQKMIQNLGDNALTQLGTVVLPIVKMSLEAILPLLQFLADHSEALIPILAGVVAGFAAFSIIQSVITLMEIWKMSTIAATLANGGLAASLKAVGAAMIMPPMGIAVAIGAVIAVVVALVRNWDKVTEAAKKFWEMLKGFGSFLKEHFVDILLAVMGPIGWIIKGISKLAGLKTSAKAVEEIPAYATGGFTDGISIAGEAGTEAVISFDPAYRAKNIDIWQKAGQLLGIGSSNGGSYNLGGFTFSPKLYISESMSADDVINKLKSAEGEFCDMIDEWLARKTAGSYAGTSMAY